MVKDLENEIAETTASLKNCMPETDGGQASAKASAYKAGECGQYERKLKLTRENLLRVKEQCDKGLTPDYLPKVIENPGAVPCAHCGADRSLPENPPAKVLTGLPLSGNVLDLKGADPILASVAGKSKAPAAIGVIPEPVQQVLCICANGLNLGWMLLSECQSSTVQSRCGTVVPPLCSANQDLVNGSCVPKCTGGQTRNAAGACECPAGQVFSAGKCGCPPGQTLTAEGKCAASGGGAGGTIQPPAKGSGFWTTKAGNFLKAIGVKWIWDNIIKPIVAWVKSLFQKQESDEETAQRKITEWKERSKGLPTAVMVCDGNGSFRPQLNKYADAPCGVADCSRVHEEEHIKDFKGSEEYKNWCITPNGANKLDGTVVEISVGPFYNNTECNAFTASAACLKNKRANAATSAEKTFLTEQLNESNFKRVEFCQW